MAAGNRPFSPQYPLWTDGATKRRWVHLPEGTSIDASDTRRWEFPVGTRFWKEFSFAGRRVETRVLWKASAGGWLAGSYVWNQDGTDAVLANDGMAGAIEIVPGRQHNIPSGADCAACHGDARAPLGFNPLQLSNDRDPNAIHGEPLTREMITLQTLIDERRLTGIVAASWRRHPPRIDTRDPQTRTVLGYLSGNCGACHNGDGQISAQVPSFAYADLMDGADSIAERMIGQPTRWQAPGRTGWNHADRPILSGPECTPPPPALAPAVVANAAARHGPPGSAGDYRDWPVDFGGRSGNERLKRVLATIYNRRDLLQGGRVRILTVCVLLLLTGIATAAAQPAGPYLTGQIGTSAGDGGAALMTGVAVGYMSPKRLAFELEITVSPSLDFNPPPVSILAIFPPPRFESEGRMIWFQTNAIGTLVDAGKLRVAVAGGGGTANLHREITYSILALHERSDFLADDAAPATDRFR